MLPRNLLTAVYAVTKSNRLRGGHENSSDTKGNNLSFKRAPDTANLHAWLGLLDIDAIETGNTRHFADWLNMGSHTGTAIPPQLKHHPT